VPQPRTLEITYMAQTGASQMVLQITSELGQRYQVQYLNDVAGSRWTNEGNEVTALAANTAVAVAYSSSNPQRFYRVVAVD